MKRIGPIGIPPMTIAHYGHGVLPKTWTPGDVGVVRNRNQDWVDELIRARERRTCGKTAWSDLDHTFCVTGADGRIVEANAPGVQVRNGSEYANVDFWIISPKILKTQRDLVVAFWESQVGYSYDYLDFIATQAPVALWGADFSLHGDRAYICSGLACAGWAKIVVSFSYPAEKMTPADICKDCGVDLDEDPLPLGWFAKFLDMLTIPGRLLARLFS